MPSSTSKIPLPLSAVTSPTRWGLLLLLLALLLGPQDAAPRHPLPLTRPPVSYPGGQGGQVAGLRGGRGWQGGRGAGGAGEEEQDTGHQEQTQSWQGAGGGGPGQGSQGVLQQAAPRS